MIEADVFDNELHCEYFLSWSLASWLLQLLLYFCAVLQWLQKYKRDFRLNSKLALPIMAAQLGQVTTNIADNIMVGQLGAAPLAAVSLANAIFYMFIVFGMGISFGLPPLIAQAHGGKKYRRISLYVKNSFIINVGYAVIALLLMLLSEPLLAHMGQDGSVVSLAEPYLIITAWSVFPFMVFQTLRTYADGMSQTMHSMIAVLVANVANIVLNYGLIFGKLGMPELGVVGAAVGTFISRVIMIMVIVVLLYFWKDLWTPLTKINIRRFNPGVMRRILSLGIPTSLQMFFEVSAFSIAAILMGVISKEAQAAHQIAINLASITFLICTGLAMATTIRVGNQLGLHNMIAVRRVGISAMIQVTLFMLACVIFFIFMRHFLPTLYIDNEEVIAISAMLLVFAAIFQIPDGVQVVALGSLRGLQDVNIPTIITFFSYYIIGIPISAIATFYFGMGPAGIWLGLVIGLSISAGFLTQRFLRLSKRELV